MKNNITFVTGIFDLGRDKAIGGFERSFNHYIDKQRELLEALSDYNVVIYLEKKNKDLFNDIRSSNNTVVRIKEIDEFRTHFPFYNEVSKIRTDSEWLNQAIWLRDSTQASMELYNPMIMSKMFFLHDEKIMNPFNSDYLFWIDGGLTNTVHPGYFYHDKVFDKITAYISKFSFVCFPYEAEKEVHGFSYEELCKLAGCNTTKVARGGFFGGPKETISQANTIYYDILQQTLCKGLMGTEESLFTLMVYKYPELFEYAEIEANGFISKFFEDIKNDSVSLKREYILNKKSKKEFTDRSALYVITFNSPAQFETLIKSIKEYDVNLLNKTTKFLLDNSTDKSTFEEYTRICTDYNFEHIKKDNLGICGGRQFIAEHFDSTDLDYMFFFEDDMFLCKKRENCKNGFNRYIDSLYDKVLNIMANESYDFLKLSFTEFYGDNSVQWSWYNVPQEKREEYWPDYCKLPEYGLDKNSPRTVFKNIKSFQGLPYADGEIYYSNWPQIITKEANKKMFLDTKWAHPFEQTWMSHFFQMTKRGELNPAILLSSPIEHDRFEHYDGNLRKES